MAGSNLHDATTAAAAEASFDTNTNAPSNDSSYPALLNGSDYPAEDLDNATINYTNFFAWELEPHLQATVVPVLFCVIFIVGLIGNGTLIFTVAINKVMRNVPNILIVSLSLGDFLLVLISVPLTSTIFTFVSWPYGEAACKFNFFMQTLSLGVTVFTLTALSVDRYLAIVDPMSKHTGKTQATTLAVSAGIWILSFILAIPDIFLSTEVVTVLDMSRKKFCFNFPQEYTESPDKTIPKIYHLSRFFIFFALPVCIIACFYLLMAQILIRSGKQIPCEGKGGGLNQQRQIAARKKVARVVLSFVLIFVVCWLPRHIYLLWYYFDDSQYNDFWNIFKILGYCLTYINSCVNPFALYLLSSQFRKYYNRYLFCCFKRVRYTSLEPSSTLHNFNSTVRRASSTNTSIVHSQSMC